VRTKGIISDNWTLVKLNSQNIQKLEIGPL
jgi:hypothetical protein